MTPLGLRTPKVREWGCQGRGAPQFEEEAEDVETGSWREQPGGSLSAKPD